jgi:uncharacterized protein
MRIILLLITLTFTLYNCVNSNKNVTMENNFERALISDKPSDELGANAEMYNWLIGGWNVKAIDYLSDGTTVETFGEWYFAWVLEGRAVQDVWIAPKRETRRKETSKVHNRYGSTIRTFDFNTKTWTINWFNPVNGANVQLAVEKKGNDIVQSASDKDGILIRWIFTDIKTESFRWYGEWSMDGGQTWNKDAEFFGTKMK